MAGKYTYFISDTHLGAAYLSNPRESERRVVRWLQSIKDSAERIYLLGDIIDYWFEYRNVVPRGFVRFFGKLAELADAGITITWITGNHDIWIFDYLPSELGIKVVTGTITEQIGNHRFLLDHGDKVGCQPRGFRLMSAVFHNRFCQRLYATLHPRLTMPFAYYWSKSNRLNRSAESIAQENERGLKILRDFSEQHSATHPDVDFYIFGHMHVVNDSLLSSGKRMVVLGEWINGNTFARFDGDNLELLHFD